MHRVHAGAPMKFLSGHETHIIYKVTLCSQLFFFMLSINFSVHILGIREPIHQIIFLHLCFVSPSIPANH